ncbi:MAG: hypothetical protein MRK01_02345 [Candidatus Scalindua sp.]|nr:hypothetical protein [Candidatus Scalindua sp.]
MSSSKIRIDKELLKKATAYAAKKGYSSVEEFVNHMIEKEILKFDESASEEEIKKRLQGLGYLS